MNLKNITDDDLREEYLDNPLIKPELLAEMAKRFANQKLPTKPDLSELWNNLRKQKRTDAISGWFSCLSLLESQGRITLNDINK